MTTVLESLNKGLHSAFASDQSIFLLGEDILDPYGGAFKVVKGLSTAYPDRVISTPISEAGFTAVAAGMALRGLRPVVEIMFGDFLTLAADQLVNHASKYRWMYNDKVSVPMVIRTPMGGRRGYGPTHSQTIEKIFLGIPGLSVYAPNIFIDPGSLLSSLILTTLEPILFIENKLQYLESLVDFSSLTDFEVDTFDNPLTTRITIKDSPRADLTLVAYGYMASFAFRAMYTLAFDHEIFCELIVPARLSPFDSNPLIESVRRTRHVMTIEEGTLTMGWGAEVLARLSASVNLLSLAARVAALDLPVPASPALEQHVLPDIDEIISLAIKIVNQ